jgi:hypothetical protein
MTTIIFKTNNLEHKRKIYIAQLERLDVQGAMLKKAIQTMSSDSDRPKDKLFYLDLNLLKKQLHHCRDERQTVQNKLGRLNKMIKNKHRFENGNLSEMI